MIKKQKLNNEFELDKEPNYITLIITWVLITLLVKIMFLCFREFKIINNIIFIIWLILTGIFFIFLFCLCYGWKK